MGSPRLPTEFGYKARVADTADGFAVASAYVEAFLTETVELFRREERFPTNQLVCATPSGSARVSVYLSGGPEGGP